MADNNDHTFVIEYGEPEYVYDGPELILTLLPSKPRYFIDGVEVTEEAFQQAAPGGM